MTRVFGLWVLFVVVGTALMFLAFTPTITSSSFPDNVSTRHWSSEMARAHNRKLKEKIDNTSNEKNKTAADNMNLEDYHPSDPVPSSKAAIKTGPIEHGSPLIPSIPKPGPPSDPNNGN